MILEVSHQYGSGKANNEMLIYLYSATVGPICVPKMNEPVESLYKANFSAVIAGWGSDGKRTSYNILQKVEIPLVEGEICKKAFQRVRVRIIPELQVCNSIYVYSSVFVM
jgi:hypothetical protein